MSVVYELSGICVGGREEPQAWQYVRFGFSLVVWHTGQTGSLVFWVRRSKRRAVACARWIFGSSVMVVGVSLQLCCGNDRWFAVRILSWYSRV